MITPWSPPAASARFARPRSRRAVAKGKTLGRCTAPFTVKDSFDAPGS
jgi:hypothetical protein